MDKKARDDFDRQLDMPPPSATAEQIAALPEWDEDAAGAAFMALVAARGGSARLTAQGVQSTQAIAVTEGAEG